MSKLERLLIIDFGSQFTQLIARRLRELGVFSEIIPFQKVDDKNLKEYNPKAVILSGGPASVLEKNSPRTPLNLFDGLDEYRTPLYVGLSDVNLQGRFNNHCQGRLPGVKQLVNTWNTSGLIFKYSVIEDQIDERSIEQLLYDLESEFLMVFGPSANLRKQKP
mgnify:CR=1 FL=1